MAISEAVLNALLIEIRGTLSQSPLDLPIHDDQRRSLERRCREAIESEPNLELVAWLAETWTLSRGLEGLRDGLQLVTQLLDEKWDPERHWYEYYERSREYGAQLSALDKRLSRSLLAVPVTTWRGLNLRGYLELRLVERFSKDQMEEYVRIQREGPAEAQTLAHAWNETRSWYSSESSERLREVITAIDAYTTVAQRGLPYSAYADARADLPLTRGMLTALERAFREVTPQKDTSSWQLHHAPSNEDAERSVQPATSPPDSGDSFRPATREEAVRYLLHATLFICRDDPEGLACLMLERAVRVAVSSGDGWFADLKRLEHRIKRG